MKRVSEAGRLLVQADMTFALSNVGTSRASRTSTIRVLPCAIMSRASAGVIRGTAAFGCVHHLFQVCRHVRSLENSGKSLAP